MYTYFIKIVVKKKKKMCVIFFYVNEILWICATRQKYSKHSNEYVPYGFIIMLNLADVIDLI